MKKQKHIHFIGICGVAMSALALAFKKQNWKVTGSDVGFYPPISTHLKEADIDFYPGWHPDKMGTPDLVVVGNVASSTNPEWLCAQEKKLSYKSYPEVIAEYFIKPNSIVCAGTYGKSTSSTLLTWILKEAGFNPSYMFGGLSLNNMLAAEMSDSDWSVVEGDEYKTSRWDNGPKFAYYSPTHLLLTSVIWDHADVYPTEKAYVETFKKLMAMVPENGLKVVSEQTLTVILSGAKDPSSTEKMQHGNLGKQAKSVPSKRDSSVATLSQNDNLVTYGKNPANNYSYTNLTSSKTGTTFDIIHNNQTYHIKTSCLGDYMADNITGCFALANKIGIEPEKIIAAIASFQGMKRRLEKRYEGAVTVFDDIAHSPAKAASVLKTLKNLYNGKIYAVFEPNTGNRRNENLLAYDNAFAHADEVIIPRLTKVKQDNETKVLEGNELATVISKTNTNTRYVENDEELLAYLKQKTQPGDVIVFMGSHGFRGMIEELIKTLK